MSLQEKVKNLPRTPGVYIFKNAKGKPIYVGKALRLRNRVSSYFAAKRRNKLVYFQKPSNATRQGGFSLRDDIADIEVRRTSSEIEALILEASLIKTLKPRYNVAMKDDKQYFYVGFTAEQFPKIIITHQRKLKTKNLLRSEATMLRRQSLETTVGPFVSGRALKSTLRTLRRVFPYCTCKRPHLSRQTCLNYHLGIDPGFCCEKKPTPPGAKKIYQGNIMRINHIIQGKAHRVIGAIKKEMEAAAGAKRFERAAVLRGELDALNAILAHRRVMNHREEQGTSETPSSLLAGVFRIEGYDISNVQGRFAVGSMVVFTRNDQGILVPQKSDYRRFKIRGVKGANDPAMIKEVLTRRLRHPEWPFPQVMLIDGGITQRNAALQAIARVGFTEPPAIWSLAKREEELYTAKGKVLLDHVPSGDARALKLLRDEAHRFAIGYYREVHKKYLIPHS